MDPFSPEGRAIGPAYGAILKAGLDMAAASADLEPFISAADATIEGGFWHSLRAELLAMTLYRNELALQLDGHPGRYHDVAVRLVEARFCTARDMRDALLGTLLMLGQQRGHLDASFYDFLAQATAGSPEWRTAMSTIRRRSSTPTRSRPAKGKKGNGKRRRR